MVYLACQELLLAVYKEEQIILQNKNVKKSE